MKRLREVREQRGLSQTALAGRVGVTQQAIAAYEAGDRRPTGDILVRLSAELGVSSAYLMELTDDPQRADYLPHDWEQVVQYAISQGLTPGDVHLAIQMLLMATGRKTFQSNLELGQEIESSQVLVRAKNEPHGNTKRRPHQDSLTR